MSALPHDRRKNPTRTERHVCAVSPVVVDLCEPKAEDNQTGGNEQICDENHGR